MTIREEIEQKEKVALSQFATLAVNSKGRLRDEPKCKIRTRFMQDRDRILHSEFFRRLKHKTQVFLAPMNDLYRTRLTHTLEVAQIARTISRALSLNEDLTEAIALGHDLGHTPFGHAGELVLKQLYHKGFSHAEQSLRVVDKLERKGGLNLTIEVRDGILNHSKAGKSILPVGHKDCPMTIEGEVVRVSDSIAYVNHDIEDAIRSKIVKHADFPQSSFKVLGADYSNRIDRMVTDICEHSAGKPHIYMSKKILEETEILRAFLFAKVYPRQEIDGESIKAARTLKDLYNYLKQNPQIALDTLKGVEDEDEETERVVVDYVAMMTDWQALELYKNYFEPKPWLE